MNDKFKVIKVLKELSGNKKVVLISWYERPITLDIRKFDGDTPLKGISIDLNDIEDLKDAIKKAEKHLEKDNQPKDHRPNVNLMEHLGNVNHIIDNRSKGVPTVNGGRIELKLKKKK
jgi:hypothetical protein